MDKIIYSGTEDVSKALFAAQKDELKVRLRQNAEQALLTLSEARFGHRAKARRNARRAIRQYNRTLRYVNRLHY